VVALVDKVINLRTIEEATIEYQIERVDFVRIARRAAEEMGHMALSRGLNLSFSGPDHEIIVRGDDQKLYQIIQNLIDNAVKYTKKGSITVKVEERGSEAVLSIADSGIGISAEVIPLLFQEFVRDKNIAKEIHGTGMGLFIARIFIEAQGGKIWVESKGVEKGSTFYISLPIEK